MTSPSLAARLGDADDLLAGLLAARAASSAGLARSEAQCVLAMLRQAEDAAEQLESALTAALAAAWLAEYVERAALIDVPIGNVVPFARRRSDAHV